MSDSPRETARTLAGSTGGTNEHTKHTPLLIDAKAACALLSMGARRLWVLTNMNAVPHRRIGRSVRYSPAELAAWVASGCPTEGGAGARVRKAVSQ